MVRFFTNSMKSVLVVSLVLGVSGGSMVLSEAAPLVAIAATPQETEAERHNAQGDKRFEANDFTGAIAAFSQVIAIDPKNAQSYFNRGYVRFKGLNDFAGALPDLSRAVQLKPDFADAYSVRAYVQLNLKNYQDSLTDYDRALALSPQSAAIWQERALLKQAYLKDLAGAIQDFDRAIELTPNDAMNYGFRGLAKRDLGQREGAIFDLRRCLTMARSQNNGDLVAMMQENLRGLGASE
jgi:tetratricopeptide (TPR) repeat protein